VRATFSEVIGRPGSRVIGRAGGGHGAIHFVPGYGPSGRRAIEALIERDGVPRLRTRIATYQAPAPRRPGQVTGLRVTRHRTTLRIRWRSAPLVAQYLVRVDLSNGRSLVRLVTSRAHALTLTAIAKRTRARVAITALDLNGRRGPVARGHG
jgi:hypothetical protein